MRQSLLKRLAYKTSTFLVLTLVIVSGLSLNMAISSADNLSIATPQDCTSNSVIYCGVTSVSDLQNKYANGDGVNSAESIHHIYSFFGISANDIKSMNASGNETVERGTVYKDGNVYDAGGKLIARTAITAGRQNMAGSVYDTYGSTNFYERTPSVSFVRGSLEAYIVKVNNQFSFAILASCGNPVMATPVPAPKPAPTPAPVPTPKPAPKPSNTTIKTTINQTTLNYCSGNTTNLNYDGISAQGGNCSQNTTIVAAPAEQQPTPFGQCTSLSLSIVQSSPLVISVTANPNTENGATVSSVVYDFGDRTAPTAPSSQLTQTHTYAAAGNYTITATLSFTGGAQQIPNATCEATVNSTSPPPAAPTVVTTSSVTTSTPVAKPSASLVNTGPGDVIALFGATSLIGMVGYRLFLGRHV